MLRLQCKVQNYAWGNPGSSSAVAQLAHAGGSAETIDEGKPYAEFWMGTTHPNGPSFVVGSGDGKSVALKDHLAANPHLVGEGDADSSDGSLPFLFKVLSVAKGLSIQAHPDKTLGAKLHAARPDVYKDPNHKPEMACALTPFEAMCGFEAASTIADNIDATPELQAIVGKESSALLRAASDETSQKAALKTVFTSLMTHPKESVIAQANALQQRLSKDTSGCDKDFLALRLCGQYPGDVGVFCPYFLCYRKLEIGQAVFLGANEPHAYLAGDCVEIMACSDNVVRAGCTPKLRDTDTLCEMLTYRQPAHSDPHLHPGNVLVPEKVDERTSIYTAPDRAVTEFQLECVSVPAGEAHDLSISKFCSVILAVQGECALTEGSAKTSIKRGDVFFQPAGSAGKVEASSDALCYRVTLRGATQK